MNINILYAVYNTLLGLINIKLCEDVNWKPLPYRQPETQSNLQGKIFEKTSNKNYKKAYISKVLN